jgi:hypothetical protein
MIICGTTNGQKTHSRKWLDWFHPLFIVGYLGLAMSVVSGEQALQE